MDICVCKHTDCALTFGGQSCHWLSSLLLLPFYGLKKKTALCTWSSYWLASESLKFHSCGISHCHDYWLAQSHLPFLVLVNQTQVLVHELPADYQLSHLIFPVIMLKSTIRWIESKAFTLTLFCSWDCDPCY